MCVLRRLAVLPSASAGVKLAVLDPISAHLQATIIAPICSCPSSSRLAHGLAQK